VGILTEDMKRVVRDQQLGFWATVNDDGTPNLSPRGTTRVWDDDHLFFGDICSPRTTANVLRGSRIEVNVVDPFVRKGYRFSGAGTVHPPGTPGFDEGVARMREEGSRLVDRVRAVVVLEVDVAEPVISPIYHDGSTREEEVIRIHQARFARLHDSSP
jgi:predicted pyridoxine 5'-phosphate oxidase superfamily flavin-nucleotide-binding protein